MSITWCVAHTHSLKEHVAKQHLLQQGFEVYLPQFKKIRRHARKVDEVLSPLFPRYLFVGMDKEGSSWRSINGTQGVSHVLMSNPMTPACVPLSAIQDLKSQEISDGVVKIESLVTFSKGEKVRVLEGVFKGKVVTFCGLDDKSRVQLFLNFLGRETMLSLPVCAVEAA
ncbi:MAG: transcriptional activator RfaH [Alphaproteobacteria bacterium]|nr:transcriptional activator RfaH [Alphaproteobacteria bacterium]